MTVRLLVTGFGPFPRMPRNPSAGLARRVAEAPRWRLADVEASCRILTTAYSALSVELDPALAGADAVLMIGVAVRDPRIRVERRATNRISTLFPDASGRRGAAASADLAQSSTRVAPVKALRCLRAEHLASRISHDAGRYLCNASYVRALASGRPVLFIHIPLRLRAGRRPRTTKPRAGYDDRLRDALVDIARILVAAARRDAIAGAKPPR